MGGSNLWKQTSRAVQAALGEEDAVDITHLQSLLPLRKDFDDQVQDDAARFLTSLVELAGTDLVVDEFTMLTTDCPKQRGRPSLLTFFTVKGMGLKGLKP